MLHTLNWEAKCLDDSDMLTLAKTLRATIGSTAKIVDEVRALAIRIRCTMPRVKCLYDHIISFAKDN